MALSNGGGPSVCARFLARAASPRTMRWQCGGPRTITRRPTLKTMQEDHASQKMLAHWPSHHALKAFGTVGRGHSKRARNPPCHHATL